jgi:hypothetical protein
MPKRSLNPRSVIIEARLSLAGAQGLVVRLYRAFKLLNLEDALFHTQFLYSTLERKRMAKSPLSAPALMKGYLFTRLSVRCTREHYGTGDRDRQASSKAP